MTKVYTVYRNATDEKGQTAERGVANMLAVGCSGRVVEYSDRFDVVKD